MFDWVDKGLVRSSQGVNSGSQVSVDGVKEVLKGAMEDELQSRWWLIAWWAGLGMRRERVLVGKEKQHAVSNGHVGAWAGVGDGECFAEVTWKGIDECGQKFTWRKIGFKVSWEDMCDLGKEMELDAVEFDGKVVRKMRGIAKGGTKAIASIDDGPIGPKEGNEGRPDIVEGQWFCGGGREDVALGCPDGVSGTEGSAGVALKEDVFSQRKAREASGMGGRFGGRMRARAWLKAKAVRHMSTGSWVERRQGRVPKIVSGGSYVGIVNLKGVVWERGIERSRMLRPL